MFFVNTPLLTVCTYEYLKQFFIQHIYNRTFLLLKHDFKQFNC
jgi:hypothetical protein